ncbi:MAG: DUF4325 domain-containing protein [Pseudomonadota bacterium]
MVGLRKRGEDIRCFIIENVEEHPRDITTIAAEKFDVSRQAINKHINKLVEQGSINRSGKTRNRTYTLAPTAQYRESFELSPSLEEDQVWRRNIKPRLGELPDNVMDIWHYGMTEMINNAIDHSDGATLLVNIVRTAQDTKAIIHDDGIGIFRKIMTELDLEDERHAVLELSKGKLTTDPTRHTGEGIFFTSRVFDSYAIMSGEVYFSHNFEDIEDFILQNERPMNGTTVFMDISNNTARTTKSVFDQYTTDEDYGFNKTVVPVKLAQYGNENLVSRSQAKRLLARVDRFRIVVFDFEDVETIGQAFADEIFRVFASNNADVEIYSTNMTKDVAQMVGRAKVREA